MVEEAPKILTKPLPQILDEMEATIKMAAEAEETAKAAKRAAEEAIAKAEKVGIEAKAAARETILKAENLAIDAGQTTEAATAEAMKIAENAWKKAEGKLMSSMVKKVISSWEMITMLGVVFLGAVLAAIAIAVGLGLM